MERDVARYAHDPSPITQGATDLQPDVRWETPWDPKLYSDRERADAFRIAQLQAWGRWIWLVAELHPQGKQLLCMDMPSALPYVACLQRNCNIADWAADGAPTACLGTDRTRCIPAVGVAQAHMRLQMGKDWRRARAAWWSARWRLCCTSGAGLCTSCSPCPSTPPQPCWTRHCGSCRLPPLLCPPNAPPFCGGLAPAVGTGGEGSQLDV